MGTVLPMSGVAGEGDANYCRYGVICIIIWSGGGAVIVARGPAVICHNKSLDTGSRDSGPLTYPRFELFG